MSKSIFPGSLCAPDTALRDETLKIAKNCRHDAMCKVDFLGTGVCASGLEKQYASFYPVGRMDLYAAIVENALPITEKCIEITDSCDLCGKCDYQCYFVNEMRPSRVMKALKDHVAGYRNAGGRAIASKDDLILTKMKEIVGNFWATNDAAVRIAYHHDLCPHVTFKMPDYVVMPNSAGEISALVKLLNKHGVDYAVRGNGASSHGLVFSEGAVLDLNRMKTIAFDEKNWSVRVEPGVASFALQSQAEKRGYRVHTAEPASLVCANIMTTGILSTFSTTYGIAADNFIDAEFIARDGSFFSLSDRTAPNVFSFNKALSEREAFAICVSVRMKLHPSCADEEGVLVPFESLATALDFTRECATRRIGLALGILGGEFVSTFLAPTKKLAATAKDVFTQKLGMPYLVLVIGDGYALRSVREMGYPVISQELFKVLSLGLPKLHSAAWLDLLKELTDDEPFSYLRLGQFTELAATALAPSPAQLADDVIPDLRPFFESLYSRPEMTNLAWLNTFRVQSARYCRDKPCVALVCLLPVDTALIAEIQSGLQAIAKKHRLKSEFGFITPIDNGKRCIWEYDYYFNHADLDEISRIQLASREAGALLDAYSQETGTLRQGRYITNQGCCRKESLLYS